MIILLIPLTPIKANEMARQLEAYQNYTFYYKTLSYSSDLEETLKKQFDGELHHSIISELVEHVRLRGTRIKFIFNAKLFFLNIVDPINIKNQDNLQKLCTTWFTYKIPQLLLMKIYKVESRRYTDYYIDYVLKNDKLFLMLLKYLAKFIGKFYVVSLILTEMQIDFEDEKSIVTRLRPKVTNIWVINANLQDNTILELIKSLANRHLKAEKDIPIIDI